MTDQQLNNLAEDVRTEGYNPSGSMKDLVFDPLSGEFKQVRKGSATGSGEVVTEMTNKGFACKIESPVIYLKNEDVAEFLSSGLESSPATANTWEEESVTHITLHEPKHSFGQKQNAVFFKNGNVPVGDFPFAVECSNSRVRVLQKGTDGFKEVSFSLIPSRDELYSRSKGILEVDVLKDKRVLIVGLGSFGSQISIELAKAGVGHFVLCDFDRVELHNLSRHTATVHDLGRLKTDVLEDAIHGKNPYAEVVKLPVNVNDDLPLLYSEVEKSDIVICATDNNTSRFNISKALVEKGKIGIFGRAITRAEGGDVFRYRPGGPCYCCLIGEGNLQEEEITDVASARKDGRIAAYVSPEDAEAMVQVGLSSDIEPICNMMVKLTLMELSRGTASGLSCLEDEFVYDYYIWANRRERHYANWSAMPAAGGMPTIMRWYGARIEKEKGCPICGKEIVLDDSIPDDQIPDCLDLSL